MDSNDEKADPDDEYVWVDDEVEALELRARVVLGPVGHNHVVVDVEALVADAEKAGRASATICCSG